MPYACTVYACGYCGITYNSYESACACEQSGPASGIRVPSGSLLTFEDESTMFGTRYSYSTNSGIVVYSYVAKQNNLHIWAHIVKFQDSEGLEGVVIASDHGYICPAEYKYRAGYADHMRSLQMNQPLLYPIHY